MTQSMTSGSELLRRDHALAVFQNAVKRVSPECLVADAIHIDKESQTLDILGEKCDLSGKGVRLLAFGKASLLMAK